METQTQSSDFENLYKDSLKLEGGMGALAWAALEMFRRGGMEENERNELFKKMIKHFANPSNEECNLILRVLEARLGKDRSPASGSWY